MSGAIGNNVTDVTKAFRACIDLQGALSTAERPEADRVTATLLRNAAESMQGFTGSPWRVVARDADKLAAGEGAQARGLAVTHATSAAAWLSDALAQSGLTVDADTVMHNVFSGPENPRAIVARADDLHTLVRDWGLSVAQANSVYDDVLRSGGDLDQATIDIGTLRTLGLEPQDAVRATGLARQAGDVHAVIGDMSTLRDAHLSPREAFDAALSLRVNGIDVGEVTTGMKPFTAAGSPPEEALRKVLQLRVSSGGTTQ
jgi:hypothetical protein